MSQELSVRNIIARHADAAPESLAIGAPGRGGLSYARLLAHMDRTAATLRSLGVRRGDGVAVVLPNGPEMAAAFLAVASAATCAPLNPAYRETEFDFYLSDLDAKALIVPSGADSPARAVAAARGIPVIELSPAAGGEAGLFTLEGAAFSRPSDDAFAGGEGTALVLHTSGTTSRPKMVPLTHTNICTSAANVAATLELTPPDRCLNMMPLFHIHGIIGAMLSSLCAGASIICTPGFLAPRFFEWTDECEPTWYSAVPTMHQAILARAAGSADAVARCRLRLIRSSSAALPPRVMAELERVFGCPVIESYGMTEAAHQMASNPLLPRKRKPGSVGIAAGPEVGIMDAAGRLLGRGRTGEIVIRGPNVTKGYANNPDANRDAFTGGWFRTGDEGFFDRDDYLFISGRIKEIINRGGEKISPREIDEVLLDHPAVAQAVTFALPDERLGEDVGAAIVLSEGRDTSEIALREFAASLLADFKVPRRIVFVDEIPKGPTGKLQRIGLAEKLGLGAEAVAGAGERAPYVAPRTPVEEALAKMWAEELQIDKVGVRDDFFALGGYSVLAARVFTRVENTFGRRLPVTVLFEAPTIEKIAAILADSKRTIPPIVAMRKEGTRPPFFCMANLDAFAYAALARLLGPEQPFYGLHPEGLVPAYSNEIDIGGLASKYLDYIREVRPQGPYLLGGKCSSGYVAYEAAQQLRREGQEVALLVLFDTPGPWGLLDRSMIVWRRILRVADHMYHHTLTISRLGSHQRAPYFLEGLNRLKGRFLRRTPRPSAGQSTPPVQHRYWRGLKRARARYKPEPYDGEIVLFLTPEFMRRPGSGSGLKWRSFAAGGARVHHVDGPHARMLHEPEVNEIAAHLDRYLEEAREPTRPPGGEGKNE